MKKYCLLAWAIVVCACLHADTDYVLRVLTFEDKDVKNGFWALPDTVTRWSSLIDSQQYAGALLYGASGAGEQEQFYFWSDDGNTFLSSGLLDVWGSYCFWGGGHAISHYWTADITGNSSYTSQLTIYRPGSNAINTKGGGHNGSDNFCVHYGYRDNSGYSADHAPTLEFSDGEARVIDHMWVTNTTYALAVYVSGNSLSSKLGANDWVRIEAYGFPTADAEIPSDTARLYLANGSGEIINDWTKFDLSGLGKVVKVELNITGSSDNGFGFSQPAYFAYDDVAVRFPQNTATKLENSNDNYNTNRKVLQNGQLFIIKDQQVYNIFGQKQ